MPSSASARPTIYRTQIRRRRVVGLAVAVVATILGASAAAPPQDRVGAPHHQQAPAGGDGRKPSSERRSTPVGVPPAVPTDSTLGQADGAVPDGTTVFDDGAPGVARLDPALLTALRRAATDASDEGITLLVDSGWRSPAYQQHLLDEAVAKYGSPEEAARWVALPNRSVHVSGDAVDIGPSAASTWLSQRGARYGLCRVYANEPWHFELRPTAGVEGCPSLYADPTHDPRLRP